MRRALSLVGTVLFFLLIAIPGAQAVPGELSEASNPPAETVPQPTETSVQEEPAPQPSPEPPSEPSAPPVEEQPPPPQEQPPGIQIDSVTGFQIDPYTGYLIHPNTGYLIEPGTGRLLMYALDGTLVGSGFVWDANTGLVAEETPEQPSPEPSPESATTPTPQPTQATPTATPTQSPTPKPTSTVSGARNQEPASTDLNSNLFFRGGVVLLLVLIGAFYFYRLQHRGKKREIGMSARQDL